MDRLRCYYIAQGHQKFFDNHASLELAVCLVKNNKNSDLHIHNLKFNFFFSFAYISVFLLMRITFFVVVGEHAMVFLSEISMW